MKGQNCYNGSSSTRPKQQEDERGQESVQTFLGKLIVIT